MGWRWPRWTWGIPQSSHLCGLTTNINGDLLQRRLRPTAKLGDRLASLAAPSVSRTVSAKDRLERVNRTRPPGRVVIAGGSGFLGVSLAKHLAGNGKSVVVLSRSAPRVAGAWRHVPWDARTLGEWKRELDGAACLANLVGRSVDCVKTPDHQDEILRSRVEATRVLGEAVRSIPAPPPVWVQMSTAHIYGDPPELMCDEDSPFGAGSLHSLGARGRTRFKGAHFPISARSFCGLASSSAATVARAAVHSRDSCHWSGSDWAV